MSKIIKYSALTLMVLAVGFLIYKITTKSSQDLKIETFSAKNRDLKEDVFVPGNVYPDKEIEIKPQLSGVIDQIFVNIGDYIEEGTPIASIKLVPSALELERLQSNVKLSTIAFEGIKTSYNRAKELFKTNTISQAEMDEAQKNYDSAKAQMEAAKNQLEIQKKGKVSSSSQISNIVKSSISGTVIDLPLEQGASVVERNSMNPGTTVAVMAQMSEFRFSCQLSEQYLQNIKIGDTISLSFNAYKDLKTKAVISKISAKGAVVNGIMRYTMEAKFPVTKQMPTIRSGYTATAQIILVDKKNVLTLEEKYITYVKDSAFVFVDKDGKAQKRAIKTGSTDGIYTEIVEGITKDDKIRNDGKIEYKDQKGNEKSEK